jgi:hypothetical protein
MHQIAPVPNLNGSPADVLAEQMMEVCHALEAAAKLMAQWQPHGRDYQIGGDYKADIGEFVRRIALVQSFAEQYQREAISMVQYYD